MANEWQGPAQKVGMQAIKHLANYWANPAAYSSAAGSAAGGAGAGAAQGAAGMGAGAWASLAAPLIMGLIQYGKGSGRNDPKVRRMETMGAGKMISDMLLGKTPNPDQSWSDYRLPMKWKIGQGPTDESTGSMGSYDAQGQEIKPLEGYSIPELWRLMHERGKGHKQQGGTGDSGYGDAEIDQMFGGQSKALAKALGLDALPDWSNQKYDDWALKNSKIEEPVRYDMSGETSIPVYQRDIDRAEEEKKRLAALPFNPVALGS